ncbi:38062_t:CDS:2 [Gigaspora margarita]|uniref:38062_t:CDS:1 n=1 Tax=Gigaspora margarita TaxID=4874 RepID=A0ABN7VDQ9_GIGMA|nr:38062_t:CDS:2 [Gigaspora margarita]
MAIPVPHEDDGQRIEKKDVQRQVTSNERRSHEEKGEKGEKDRENGDKLNVAKNAKSNYKV